MKKNAIRAAVLERIVPSVLMFSMILTSFGNIAVADDTEAQAVEPAPAEVVTPAVEVEEVAETPAVIEEENPEAPSIPEFVENTVEEEANEELKAPTLDFVDAVVQQLVMPMVVQVAPAAIAACTQTTTVHSTDLDDWNLSQSSNDGSASNTIVEDGLRIKTEANGHRKAAGYYSTDFALQDLGTNNIADTFEYSTNSGSIKPGFQLVIDFDGNGSVDGILVGETVYGNNWWLTNSSPGFVKNNAPHTGGGNGSNWYGTAQEWVNNFPNARVKQIGYSLGSGVTGDYIITKMSAGCTNYTFDLPPAQPPIKVHIFKHLTDGAGTEQIPNESIAPAFPMVAVYDIAGVAAGSDPYALGDFGGAGGSDDGLKYAANTIPLSVGDDYATYENTDGSVVVPAGGTCVADKYRLVGYKVGDTYEDAESADPTTMSPSFIDIQGSKYVIVVNEDCDEISDAVAPAIPTGLAWTDANSMNVPDEGNTDQYTGTASWNANSETDFSHYIYKYWNDIPASPYKDEATSWQANNPGVSNTSKAGEFNQGEGTHHFCVAAVDTSNNQSACSEVFTITYDATDPAAPTHLSPADDSTVTTSTFLFDWTDVTDATAVVYDWIGSLSETLNPDGSLAAVLAAHNDLTDSSVNSPGTPDNTYFWQVRARDAVGNASAWTAPWKVTVDTAEPEPEPAPVSAIIEPTENETTSGMTDLLAFYADQNGDNNDAVQWAVRAGTCVASTNTVFGNVDGKNTPFTWNGTNFQSSIDTTTVANGSYCFVFNPTEDAGNSNQRLTRTFTIQNDEPVEPVDPIITSETVTVTPADMEGWAFVQEAATGSGSLEAGPSTPPMNTGSANLIVDSSGGVLLGAANHAGVALADIVALKYSTYRTAGDPALAPSIQLNIDADTTDANDSWQGRLVYEAYYTQTVTTGVWQEWDALNDAAGTGTGNWWFSNGGIAGVSGCTQSAPCTWAEVKAAYPNIAIHPTLGAVGFKAGSNWAGGYDGNVDAFVVGVKDGIDTHTTTYDFEPEEEEPVVTEPETTTTNSNNGRSGSRRSSTAGQVLGASTEDESTSGQVLGAACPLITEFLREGTPNTSGQVMILQGFLNGELGISLALSGMFDAVTTSAVKVFQSKYAAEVLLPWGLTAETPTGYVYKSTTWKINDIACPDLEVAFPQIP